MQESYRDNDVSAYGRKARPAYQRMLQDARAGRITAIVCWSVDRLTRHPRELEEIIDLYTSHGISLATVGGEINLGDPDGRMVARLVLQSQFGGLLLVVAAARGGLMAASPHRPAERESWPMRW